eukprot:5551129-Alexandrium_andersonii.AAC.1
MPSRERSAAMRPEGAPALSSVPVGFAQAGVPVCPAGRPAAPGARGRRTGLGARPPSGASLAVGPR